MSRSGTNTVSGTNHHGCPVVEKPTREPTRSVAPSRRSQRRGAPTTVPSEAMSTTPAKLVRLTADRAISVLGTAVDGFQEAQDSGGRQVWPLRLGIMSGFG